METNTKALLEEYYAILSQKGDCGKPLSEDFFFSSGDTKDARGKDGYADSMFFRYVKSLKIKTMLIDGERACAVVAYELSSPKSGSLPLEVAEIWGIRNKKLYSLAMYFDTAAYQKFMLPILFPLSRFKKKSQP